MNKWIWYNHFKQLTTICFNFFERFFYHKIIKPICSKLLNTTLDISLTMQKMGVSVRLCKSLANVVFEKNNVIQPFKVSLKEAIKIKLTLITMIITTWLRFRGFMIAVQYTHCLFQKKQYMNWQNDLKETFLMHYLVWVSVCVCIYSLLSLPTPPIIITSTNVMCETKMCEHVKQRKCVLFGRWQVIKIMYMNIATVIT